MRLSILQNIGAPPQAVETDWESFIQSIRKHVVTAQKDSVYLFSPATFLYGAARKNEYAEYVNFGVLDFDHLNPEETASIIARVPNVPFKVYLVSSFSHGAPATNPKGRNPVGTIEGAYRVIIPFLSPVPGKDWSRLWPILVSEFIGDAQPPFPVDGQCKEPSRAYYVPTVHPEREAWATFYENESTARFDPSRALISIHVRDASGRTVTPPSAAQATNTTSANPAATGARVSRGGLEALAARLKRRKVRTGDALQRVLDGTAWGEPGERDVILYQLAGDIAKEFPNADMRELLGYFSLSIDRINDPEYTPELVLSKLLRRQQEILQETERAAAERDAERASRIKAAFRECGIDRTDPYSESELERFAMLAGVSEAEFTARWVIQSGGAFYFYFNGGYIGPIGNDDATLAARKYLSPAPINLEARGPDGRAMPRSIQSLVLEYGTHARHVVADMNSDISVFVAESSTLVEAPCPMRAINPTFHEEINTWLEHLAGDKVNLLLDWISWVTELDRPCTALFLQGAPDTGKSLFANGLARIWVEGAAVTMKQALGAFNEGMTRCPLIFADERVPQDSKGNARTEDIREFIQQRERPLSRKHKSDATLKGATRVIIAANNRSLLQANDAHLTPHDIQAIADRILLIPAQPAAVDYLRAVGTERIKRCWIERDWIAEHALWIVHNRARNPHPPRFLVQAVSMQLHVDIAYGTTLGSGVAHWLLSFMDDPLKLWTGKHPRHSAHGITYTTFPGRDGKATYTPGLVVSVGCIVDNWEVYKTNIDPKKVTMRTATMALSGISEGKVDWLFDGNMRRTCHRIPISALMAWGAENGYHSDTINDNLSRLLAIIGKKAAGVK